MLCPKLGLQIQVPIVGMAPFQSMEQLGPLAVFLGVQLYMGLDVARVQLKLDQGQFAALRNKVGGLHARGGAREVGRRRRGR